MLRAAVNRRGSSVDGASPSQAGALVRLLSASSSLSVTSAFEHRTRKSEGDEALKQWCILTTRMGVDVREPTDAQLRATLEDVYVSDDCEHPNAWLRLGSDDGPMFVLDVYGSNRIVLEQWADTDFDIQLASPTTLTSVQQEVAMELWRALRDREIETVRQRTSI